MEMDKNKTSSTRSNSEERATRRSKADEIAFDWYGFAINAALTMANGALFALGGMAAKSAVDRIRPQQQSHDYIVDGSGNKKQLVGHA